MGINNNTNVREEQLKNIIITNDEIDMYIKNINIDKNQNSDIIFALATNSTENDGGRKKLKLFPFPIGFRFNLRFLADKRNILFIFLMIAIFKFLWWFICLLYGLNKTQR